MDSCPPFIRDAMFDFDNIKNEIKELKKDICSFECCAKGRYSEIKSKVDRRKKNLLAKEKLLKLAQKALNKSNIFIVPIKKKIFI